MASTYKTLTPELLNRKRVEDPHTSDEFELRLDEVASKRLAEVLRANLEAARYVPGDPFVWETRVYSLSREGAPWGLLLEFQRGVIRKGVMIPKDLFKGEISKEWRHSGPEFEEWGIPIQTPMGVLEVWALDTVNFIEVTIGVPCLKYQGEEMEFPDPLMRVIRWDACLEEGTYPATEEYLEFGRILGSR